MWDGKREREEISNTKLELAPWRMKLVSFYSDALFIIVPLLFVIVVAVAAVPRHSVIRHVFKSVKSFLGLKSHD